MGKGNKKSKSNKNVNTSTKQDKNNKSKNLEKVNDAIKTQIEKESKETQLELLNIQNNENKKLKKFKLRALETFNIKLTKDIKKMSINEVKQFAHKFDLNPAINFRVLSDLKKNNPQEYKRYIVKYKYTLDFKDALSLDCFDKDELNKILKEYNDNIKIYELKMAKINSIKNVSLFSRIKLFNLLFFLQSKEVIKMNYEQIEEAILSYSIPESLVFKIPNKFGNNELLYYSYLLILVNLLIPEKIKDSNIQISQDLTSSLNKEVYFNFIDAQEEAIEEEVDFKEISERKKQLAEYIKGYNQDIKTYKNPSTSIKTETKNKSSKELKDNFLRKLKIIDKFKDIIKEIINLADDSFVIERIKFIIKSVMFFQKDPSNLDRLSNCLKINTFSKNKEHPNEKYIEKSSITNLDEIALENVDATFESEGKNPFNYNAEYYLYPYLLKKNIIQGDEEILDSFKDFLKYVYKSKIIRDIFYMTPEFQEFAFPFDDNKIFEELFEMTIFLPFPNDILMGFTEKEIPEILVSTNLKEKTPKDTDFSLVVCECSQILNTCIHEHVKHYLKALIFYNSFQLGINKRIKSNLFEIDEERKIINAVLIRNKNTTRKNVYNKSLVQLDGGQKADILLYGHILKEITFSQSLELFKLSNWNKTIPQHIENFNKKANKNQNTIDEFEIIKLEDIEGDNDLCEFYKILSKKFAKYVSYSDEIIYNYSSFSKRSFDNEIVEGNKGDIIYDTNCYADYHMDIKDTTY